MKSFRHYFTEVLATDWEGGKASDPAAAEKGSEKIGRSKDYAKRNKSNYHRIANIGDFAIWGTVRDERDEGGDRYLILDIIHRPTDTLAGDAAMKEVVRGKTHYWKVDTVDVGTQFRKGKVGHSIAKDVYTALHELGQSIESGAMQTKGGQSIWRRLLKDRGAKRHAQFVSNTGDRPRGHKEPPPPKPSVRKWKTGDARKVWGTESDEETAVALRGKKKAKFGLPPETKTEKHAKALYKPGTAWKTQGGKWGAKNRKGAVDYFDNERTARKWAQG